MIRQGAVLTLMIVAVLASAVGVVHAKHQARQLQHELQLLRVERDRLRTEWAQLQLEESAWANPDRVARIARDKLNMRQPRHYEVIPEAP